MIESILTSDIAATESFGDRTQPGLHREEAALVEAAVETRRREFTTGRICARDALAKLGGPTGPILRGGRGEPLWPKGYFGSITHCAGYRAAAVGRLGSIQAVGIDAEPAAALPDGVLDAISLPEERRELATIMNSSAPLPFDRLLFSAKESVFKSCYSLSEIALDYEDALITFSRDGSFKVSVLHRQAGMAIPRSLEGRWMVEGGFAVTALSITG